MKDMQVYIKSYKILLREIGKNLNKEGIIFIENIWVLTINDKIDKLGNNKFKSF